MEAEQKKTKLKYLQVLSLGSNRIRKDGAASLAKAFGLCPLHRLVLHGNKDLASSDTIDLFRFALTPDGWQRSVVKGYYEEKTDGRSKFHATPMAVITPLIFVHVRNRWVTDHVLVRPFELARKLLLQEIYKKDSSYVDDRIDEMPQVLSWMGRVGTCSRPPNHQSQLGNNSGEITQLAMCHSDGCKECQACKNTHFNDIYLLMRKMPQMAEWFRNIACCGTPVWKSWTVCIESNLSVLWTLKRNVFVYVRGFLLDSGITTVKYNYSSFMVRLASSFSLTTAFKQKQMVHQPCW